MASVVKNNQLFKRIFLIVRTSVFWGGGGGGGRAEGQRVKLTSVSKIDNANVLVRIKSPEWGLHVTKIDISLSVSMLVLNVQGVWNMFEMETKLPYITCMCGTHQAVWFKISKLLK